MMRHQHAIAVFSASDELFEQCQKVAGGLAELHRFPGGDEEVPAGVEMALVDNRSPGNLRPLLAKLAARAIYTVLVYEEARLGDSVPTLLAEGIVDDLLLLPLRPVELLGKIKHASHLGRAREVAIYATKTLIEKFEYDIRAARAIQRSLIPEKFAAVPGMKISHKYLSGLKSGGDYLRLLRVRGQDLRGLARERLDGLRVVIGVHVGDPKIGRQVLERRVPQPRSTVAKVFEELRLAMKPKESLSIFYALLNRKTFELTYAGAGSIRFVHQSEGKFSERKLGSEALMAASACALADHSVTLLPGDRITVFSDGFGDAFGEEGSKGIERAFTKAYRRRLDRAAQRARVSRQESLHRRRGHARARLQRARARRREAGHALGEMSLISSWRLGSLISRRNRRA